MTRTTLENPENNLMVKIVNGNVSINDVIKSIEFRINKHREFIKIEREEITTYIDCNDIVLESLQCIIEHESKIHELQELLRYTFNVK